MTTYVSRVPVIPGKPPSELNKPCSACGSTDSVKVMRVVAATDMTLCQDSVACARRYRQGMSPDQYQQHLSSAIR